MRDNYREREALEASAGRARVGVLLESPRPERRPRMRVEDHPRLAPTAGSRASIGAPVCATGRSRAAAVSAVTDSSATAVGAGVPSVARERQD